MAVPIASAGALPPAIVAERPVDVEYGYLRHDRHRLRDLGMHASRVAMTGLPADWDRLSLRLASFAQPISAADRYALFDISGRNAGTPFRCALEVAAPAPDFAGPEAARDRLVHAAGESLQSTQRTAAAAAVEFGRLDLAVATRRGSASYAGHFEEHVLRNPGMPIVHVHRTMAIAHAEAALIALAFDPERLAASALHESVRAAARAGAQTAATYSYRPSGAPRVPEGTLPRTLLATCDTTELAWASGLRHAKRYALVLADTIVRGR